MQSDVDIRDKSFRVIEATAERLDVSPGAPRRRWSASARERILREATAPGANVSAVARAHGLKPQQLFGWRRRMTAGAGASAKEAARESSPPAVQAVPLSGAAACGVAPALSFAEVALVGGEADAAIEVVVGGDVTIRVGPTVPMARLQMVLRAVRSA